MKKKIWQKIIIATLFVTHLTIACKKDKDSHSGSNTPARRIAESEQLNIPSEVGLPMNQPGGNTRVATYYAEGVQKYKAQAKAGGGFEWAFVAPEAQLFDASNQLAGLHGAGPFWTRQGLMGSVDSIFAQQFSPARSATPDAGSIPWLLLMPKVGKTATGVFADVDYIQRIATTGGKAPAVAPQSLSDTADVFYTAIYRFSSKN